MHQKQIPCSLELGHRGLYEHATSWEATSTWGPLCSASTSAKCAVRVSEAWVPPRAHLEAPYLSLSCSIPDPGFSNFAQAIVSNLSSLPTKEEPDELPWSHSLPLRSCPGHSWLKGVEGGRGWTLGSSRRSERVSAAWSCPALPSEASWAPLCSSPLSPSAFGASGVWPGPLSSSHN